MKEFELRQPVAKWLLSRGLIPILECGSLRNCDMVGVLAIDEGACTQLIDADLRPCVNLERWRRPMWARRKEHLWRMNHPLMFRFGTHVPSKARERREAGQ